MRLAAAQPAGPLIRRYDGIFPGLRGLHTRHARAASGDPPRNPVHVVYFRISEKGVVEVMRVLHERVDLARQMAGDLDVDDPATLVGRTLLVGVTYLDSDGAAVGQVQRFGTISAIGARPGSRLVIARDGHPDFAVPYDPAAIAVAPPGTYRLRETGEAVVNPDLLGEWTVARPRTDR